MNWTAWGVELPGSSGPEGHLLVSVNAVGEDARAPLMLNLLLDRSGSMKGAPLAAAVEAAQQLVELAGPDDFLGLLVFDAVAEQRVALRPMDQQGKQAMMDALADVVAGRGTALHAAVEMGAHSLQRILVPGRRPKLLLLTDGEPSVGPDQESAFESLGAKLSGLGISVHALGLARHYVAEILASLTLPSGNGYEHVDGPEGLSEAMGAVVAHLCGEVASGATVRVGPSGFLALGCRHSYATRIAQDALWVTLGEVSHGLSRRVLLSGKVLSSDWNASITGTALERGDQRHQSVPLEKVTPESASGRLVKGLGIELELVAGETAAWLSLARRDLSRAEAQLEEAERALRDLVTLAAEGIPVRRHLERLADLRVAIERGEGDIPLLVRRAKSAKTETGISQAIPLRLVRPPK